MYIYTYIHIRIHIYTDIWLYTHTWNLQGDPIINYYVEYYHQVPNNWSSKWYWCQLKKYKNMNKSKTARTDGIAMVFHTRRKIDAQGMYSECWIPIVSVPIISFWNGNIRRTVLLPCLRYAEKYEIFNSFILASLIFKTGRYLVVLYLFI